MQCELFIFARAFPENRHKHSTTQNANNKIDSQLSQGTIVLFVPPFQPATDLRNHGNIGSAVPLIQQYSSEAATSDSVQKVDGSSPNLTDNSADQYLRGTANYM